MKKKTTFTDILRELEKVHKLDEEYGLDYFSISPGEAIEPKPYDDFFSITKFGSNEGIYTTFYVLRESDGSKEWIATAKTLAT